VAGVLHTLPRLPLCLPLLDFLLLHHRRCVYETKRVRRVVVYESVFREMFHGGEGGTPFVFVKMAFDDVAKENVVSSWEFCAG
jgi:hypothetical protein